MDGWINGWIEGRMNDGWTNGKADGWMRGRIDGWMDVWIGKYSTGEENFV